MPYSGEVFHALTHMRRAAVPRRRLTFCVAVGLVVAATQPALAQCKPPAPDSTISTDRPTFANSSTTVPCHSLQLETGLLESSENAQRGFDLPEASLRFGLSDTTELRLGVPDYFQNYTSGSSPATGLGDLSLGAKQQLHTSSGNGLNLALVAALSFPAGAQAVSSHGYDVALQVPLSVKLSKNWTAAGQAGLAFPTQTGRHNTTGQADIYFDRQLTKPLDAFVEYNGFFPQRGSPQHTVDFGGSFKATAHQQVDFRAGFGLSAAATDHFVGAGYSVRFDL